MGAGAPAYSTSKATLNALTRVLAAELRGLGLLSRKQYAEARRQFDEAAKLGGASPDLHFARVYISGLKEDETREVVERLQDLRGRVRKFLGQRIRLRYTPELDFRYDETTMRASRIEAILTQVTPKPAPAPEPEDDDENDSDDES